MRRAIRVRAAGFRVAVETGRGYAGSAVPAQASAAHRRSDWQDDWPSLWLRPVRRSFGLWFRAQRHMRPPRCDLHSVANAGTERRKFIA